MQLRFRDASPLTGAEKSNGAKLILACLLVLLAACTSFERRASDQTDPVPAANETGSFLTIGYGATEAEARAEALGKALYLAAGSWSSPEFGADRGEATHEVLGSGGAKFVRKVAVRLRGVSGPSRFVLAEVGVDQSGLNRALDIAVTGPPKPDPTPEIEPQSWWQPVVEFARSMFRLSTYTSLFSSRSDKQAVEAPDFAPIAAADPAGGNAAFAMGLSHYFQDPFSRPRDYLAAEVTQVGMAAGALDSGVNALGISVSLAPHANLIKNLDGFLASHALDPDENQDPRCLVYAPDFRGKKDAHFYPSCRPFTTSYPASVALLGLHFVGNSGVIGTLVLADEPFRVGFGERYLQKFETLYVRHSDAEYAAWAWRPDVRRVRGRDGAVHVMPYATLECGEDKIGTCTDWSKRYKLFLGVHGGKAQQIRFVLDKMPTDVLAKTKMVLAEILEVRDGKVISDMLPPGVRLTPEDPPPPLSHPLDEGIFAVGRSY